jgi:hypothetical protein
MSEPRKSRRRWFQYSLRSLMLVMLLASLGMSWFAVRMKRAQKQKHAVEEIRKLGGIVRYDYAVDTSGHWSPRAVPPGPGWLRNLLGEDFFTTVYGVIFSPFSIGDSTLEYLEGLTQVRVLHLDVTHVSDAGLKHLRGLTQLQELGLNGTQVTDAGMEALSGLTRLQVLDLSHTQISDVGLGHLKALKQLKCLDLDGTRITDAGLQHLNGLAQLQTLIPGALVTDEGVKKLQQALPNCESTSGLTGRRPRKRTP